jgi:hypothetical protein
MHACLEQQPEATMLRTVLLVAVLLGAPAVYAETATPDSERGRFTFHHVQDDLLRLDARTGQISTCSKRSGDWTCQAVPDERAALESEIARLQGENASLKQQMIARGVPLPEGMRPDSPGARPQIELKLPNEADIDRLMTFIERIWRRLIGMMQNMQKEADKKG